MARSSLAGRSIEVDQFRAVVTSEGVLRMDGILQMRSPGEKLGPFLRQLHEAIVSERQRELEVDVGNLTHVSSSSLFLFLDWARWIAAEPQPRRYTLHFLTRTNIAWQQLALPTMQRICAGHIRSTVR